MFTKLFTLLFNEPPETYVHGKFVFAGRLPGELRLVLFLAMAALVWILYRKAAARTSRWTYRAILSLRIALVCLLVFILGSPALRIESPRKDTLFTAVLVDTSRSMSIADVDSSRGRVSRIQAARDALFAGGKETGYPRAGIVPAIAENSRVILYSFSDTVQRAGERDLVADGPFTNLFRSVRDVEAELRAVPLAAVVLVTDGCRNSGGSTTDAARILQARGVPLYVLGIGNPRPPQDLEVVEVAAPRQVRRDTEVEVDVTVKHTGIEKPFDVVLKRGDEVLLTRRIIPGAESDLQRVRLMFTPDYEGTSKYRVEIPGLPGEKMAENNYRDFVLEIKDDRLPVLYLEGSPRLEYRFLRRALFRDKSFRLVGMLRLAQDRFYIQGASQSEEYLKKGFPDTAERLGAFQAIILGDIEAAMFTPQQMTLLEDFVKRRGGGLLMLGGVNSFGLGGYAGTPVGDMLPLRISPSDSAYSDEQFTAQPVAENLQHPVMRLAADPEENRVLWNNAPPLIGITPLAEIKAGASLLLQQPKTGRPVLAVQNYGEGRVAGFTSGGSWYWRVSKPASDELHERFWKQLIRWLVVGAKEQLSVETDAEIYARREPVTIRATVLGKDMQPADDATVVASVVDPAGNTQQIPMDWILSQEGVYQCRFVPDAEGQYQARVAVKGWGGKGTGAVAITPFPSGKDNVATEPVPFPAVVRSFIVAKPHVEFANSGLKQDALEEMAAIARGKYYDLSAAPQMAADVCRDIRSSMAGASSVEDKPIWNMPALFVLMVSVAGAEWLIRRKNELA